MIFFPKSRTQEEASKLKVYLADICRYFPILISRVTSTRGPEIKTNPDCTARNAVTRLVARALLEKPLRGLIRPGGCRKPCLIGISKPQILQGAVSEVGVCQNHMVSTPQSPSPKVKADPPACHNQTWELQWRHLISEANWGLKRIGDAAPGL